MSRKVINVNENINIIHGSDHAIGNFVDITDKRYAESGKDEQGEGYVVEWCDMFEFSNNLIGIAKNDIGSKNKITKLCNDFIEKL